MSQKLCQQCQKLIPITSQFCAFCGSRQLSQSFTGQLPPNARLDGRYVVDTLFGQGGMGAVYRAVDTRISGRLCAIKEMNVLSLPAHEQAQAVQSFQQEAQFLARLNHPNLPQIHDYFSDSSTGASLLGDGLCRRGNARGKAATKWTAVFRRSSTHLGSAAM
ncbi:MAG: hypothetical protein M5U34_47430 [Chloroflexi bacterium]|nr:hypothetical protein [Chloroflexota bacterium]